jgi:hypothetical protein
MKKDVTVSQSLKKGDNVVEEHYIERLPGTIILSKANLEYTKTVNDVLHSEAIYCICIIYIYIYRYMNRHLGNKMINNIFEGIYVFPTWFRQTKR